MVDLSRRGFIGGLIGIMAAPSIVRAASLMPVKVMEPVFTLDMLEECRRVAAFAAAQRPLYLVLPKWMLDQYRSEAEQVALSYGATLFQRQDIPA